MNRLEKWGLGVGDYRGGIWLSSPNKCSVG